VQGCSWWDGACKVREAIRKAEEETQRLIAAAEAEAQRQADLLAAEAARIE
jgi:hypothetical protein